MSREDFREIARLVRPGARVLDVGCGEGELLDLLRIGARAIVSFPNFGHWRVRLSLLAHGRMPETRMLPVPWYATPNIHLCTLRDFTRLCAELGLRIEAASALSEGGPARPIDPAREVENWRAESALFLLNRARTPAIGARSSRGDLFG